MAHVYIWLIHLQEPERKNLSGGERAGASQALEFCTRLVGIGRKSSVNTSRFTLAVVFNRFKKRSDNGSATRASSSICVSSSFGTGAGCMNGLTYLPRWFDLRSCGMIKPRCSASTWCDLYREMSSI